jgi:hypothetical protein
MKHRGNIKSKGDAKGLLHLTNCDELYCHDQIINQVRANYDLNYHVRTNVGLPGSVKGLVIYHCSLTRP